MSQNETGKTQVSRRTLAKGAAWSVPVIATAAAAPAASASVVPGSSTVGPLNYSCVVSLNGAALPAAAWTATITASTPTSVSPGDAITAPTLNASVTTDAGSAANLRALGVTSVTGTSDAPYTVAGDVVSPGTRAASLTIPSTPVPASGAITTVASGAGAAETAGSATGSITASVGNFTATLTAHGGGFDGTALNVACTLDPATQATQLNPPTQVK